MTNTVLRFAPPLEASDADSGVTPLGWAIYGFEHGWYSQIVEIIAASLGTRLKVINGELAGGVRL